MGPLEVGMFAKMKLGWKLRLVGISVLACSVVAMVGTEWHSERQMYERETARMQNLVESAATLIEHHIAAAKAGEMSVEQARPAL